MKLNLQRRCSLCNRVRTDWQHFLCNLVTPCRRVRSTPRGQSNNRPKTSQTSLEAEQRMKLNLQRRCSLCKQVLTDRQLMHGVILSLLVGECVCWLWGWERPRCGSKRHGGMRPLLGVQEISASQFVRQTTTEQVEKGTERKKTVKNLLPRLL